MPPPASKPDPSLDDLLLRFEQDRDARALLESRTQTVDSLVRSTAAKYLPDAAQQAFALCAVGGYGRRELFPYSDVDLLVAAASEDVVESLRHPLSDFLRVLWDAGLRVSQSVRTMSECLRFQEDNPELHISLLDVRFVAGDIDLWQAFAVRLADVHRFRSHLPGRMSALARARHNKFNNTVFHLEPNVKETCGGLRDLHLVRWFSQLMPGKDVLENAKSDLTTAEDFLFTQRVFLHLKARRDSNLLTFELQDQSAQALPNEPKAPEEWMRLYFACARRVFQWTLRSLDLAEAQDTSLVSQFREWRSRLSTPDFTVSGERILLRNPAEATSSPDALLRLFAFSGRHGLRLSWETGRRVTQALPELAAPLLHAPPWPVWRDFFAQPHTSLALEEMATTGVLATFLPEWRSIDSLVVRDFYHRYTVDEHTLVAIGALDDLVRRVPDRPARFCDIASQEDRLSLVRLAILLHDIGKGTRPGDHVAGSVETARSILQRLRPSPGEERVILFLIEHHLDLSLIMNGRDLEDPGTARFLSSRVQTEEDLRRLTLLTYADISAVNPTAMTPWRQQQLWQVYQLGVEQLTRELASDRFHRGDPLDALENLSPALSEFLEGFPKRYLRTHTEAEIERHFRMASFRKDEDAAIAIDHEAGFWLLTVITQDRPRLFAALCGALASFGLNILKGEASSNAAGVVLDLIRFADPNQNLELNPEEIDRLRGTIACVIRGTQDVGELLKRRRPNRRFTSESTLAPRVRFHRDASDSATLIDFTGEDRPGLLYDLAAAIGRNGCNIEVVMIDTEAHKATDVFYVTRNGCKLEATVEEALHSDLLKAAIASA